MNQWSKHTLDLVTGSNYLDQLQVIYPHEDSEREVDAETLSQEKIKAEKLWML